MTSTPRDPAGDDSTPDQDAEPSLNTTEEQRPDAHEASQDEGGSTDDVV